MVKALIPITALSISVFIYFTWWLISISYDLLALVSCLIVMPSLFLAYVKQGAMLGVTVCGTTTGAGVVVNKDVLVFRFIGLDNNLRYFFRHV